MTDDIQEIFNEIRNLQRPGTNCATRYHVLDSLLLHALKALTQNAPVDFTHMSARLHWLCKQTGHPSFPLEVFRTRAARVRKGELQPSPTDEGYDLKAVCEGLSAFYHTPLPADLQKLLPRHWRPLTEYPEKASFTKRIRITVHCWDEHFVYGRDHAQPEETLLKAQYATQEDSTFADLEGQLYEGAQLNLLSVKSVRNTASDAETYPYVLLPETVILDPDFLIDITALCACMKPYGHSPYTHILNKFTPPARSSAIQLGNAANLFLDDCVNEKAGDTTEDELYLRSIQKSFRLSPLTYSTLTDIDRSFFEQCRQQFHNIRQTVQGRFSAAEIDIRQTEVQLEPSFLCEALGIQGRMDLLTRDSEKLIELKSGKAEEYPYRAPRDEHRLQMALYKEILYYNMNRPRNTVQSYLFYSRYPQFYAIDVPRTYIRRIMALRNAILHLEHRLRNGESRQVIGELTEERLNVANCHDRLYMQYLRPHILEILHPIQHMDDTEAAYFHQFLTFTEREQFLAKTGDNRIGSSNGFAETWCSDTRTKQENGNILIDLKLQPLYNEDGAVEGLHMQLPDYGDDFLPNFRLGDIVMLYERNNEQDSVTNKQFFRCIVEEIHPDHLRLKLSYPQRNAGVFHSDSLYAIEPGYMDSTFNQAYTGLFSLLTAPKERKGLLLGLRKPETRADLSLNRHYMNEEIDRIVLKAKQAEDYFLLVGPPGTGKTSVTLKAMVEEFLADQPKKNLLLMAYTNRAVDEICSMLSTIEPQPEYIRIGQELNCDPAFRPRLMKHVIQGAASRKQIYSTLEPIRIFTGTISSLCGQMELFSLKFFDVAIIDEASQVLEPQLLPLLCAKTPVNRGDYNLNRCAIGKFILIGDHKQLPAVVTQPQDSSRVTQPELNRIGLTDCRNSLFERLHRLSHMQQWENVVEMLHRQGRMHPDISDFANHKFYNGQLDTVPLPHQQEELDYPLQPDDDAFTAFVAQTRMGFLAVEADETDGNKKSNKKEAEAIARLIHTLHLLYERKGETADLFKKIGIIVPFRAQIALIRKAVARLQLPNTEAITIDTVERYQGSQRDIVIFSTTVSRIYQLALLSEPVMTDGQAVDRKLNVALTRARKQFFMAGSPTLLKHCTAYRELLDSLNENQKFHLYI